MNTKLTLGDIALAAAIAAFLGWALWSYIVWVRP